MGHALTSIAACQEANAMALEKPQLLWSSNAPAKPSTAMSRHTRCSVPAVLSRQW